MRPRVVLVVALVMGMTSCGQGTVAEKEPARPSPAPRATSPQISPSPPYVDRGCPRQAEPPAPPPGLPADAVCVSVVHGNFDGTSPDESLAIYTLRGPAMAERVSKSSPAPPWFVRVEVGAGGVLTGDLGALFQGGPSLFDVFALAVGDARRDGRDEAFVLLSHGASTDFIGILGVENSSLAPAMVTTTGQRGFAVGGSAMHAAFLQCAGSGPSARLIESGWGSPDAGKTIDWERKSYSWSGMHLTLVSSDSGSVPYSEVGQLSLGKGLSC